MRDLLIPRVIFGIDESIQVLDGGCGVAFEFDDYKERVCIESVHA